MFAALINMDTSETLLVIKCDSRKQSNLKSLTDDSIHD